jgi:large subunit ribosomal protein L24
MLKFRVGDSVRVTLGKDKGREGKIEKIFPKQSLALVPDLNMYKKHVKPMQGQKGGIYDVPRPLAFSKLVVICPKCKKPTKIGFKLVGDEKRRVCKKCKKEVDSLTKGKNKK